MEISRSSCSRQSPVPVSPQEVVDLCGMYHDLGFQHVVFNMHNVHEIAPLDVLGHEVRPAVAAL